jgi:hypothetical protein
MAARLVLISTALLVAGAGIVHAQHVAPEPMEPRARALGEPGAGGRRCGAVTVAPDDAVRAGNPRRIARRIHCLTPVSGQLVRQGLNDSSTFRALASEVAATDVVVLVVTGRWDAQEGRGHANVRLIGAGANERFIRVWIDAWWRTRREQVALLAHELQHVLEIARAPDVRSTADVVALYRRIGQEVRDRGYETVAAQNVGAIVEAELGQSPCTKVAIAARLGPR